MTAMSEERFDLKPVDKKPSRRHRRGSKYNSMLIAFMEGVDKLVRVDVEGINTNYLRTQLSKRIQAHGLRGVKVSVVNDACYLEKVQT